MYSNYTTPASKFAENNAGKLCLVPGTISPRYNVSRSYRAKIVGYLYGYQNSVVVEFEDPILRDFCWPVHDSVVLLVSQADMYNPLSPKVWSVDYKQIELIDNDVKPTKLIQAYPSTCKFCKFPARKHGKLIVCSNKACRSRSDVFKMLNIKQQKQLNTIQCKHCNRRATYLYKTKSSEKFSLGCEIGHIFQIHIKDLKKNDVVLHNRKATKGTNHIWNGEKWESI